MAGQWIENLMNPCISAPCLIAPSSLLCLNKFCNMISSSIWCEVGSFCWKNIKWVSVHNFLSMFRSLVSSKWARTWSIVSCFFLCLNLLLLYIFLSHHHLLHCWPSLQVVTLVFCYLNFVWGDFQIWILILFRTKLQSVFDFRFNFSFCSIVDFDKEFKCFFF